MHLTQSKATRLVDNRNDLDLIHDPDVNLVILRRTVSPQVKDFADELIKLLPKNRKIEGYASNLALETLLEGLPQSQGFELFLADLAYQVELFSSTLQKDYLNVKLQSIRDALCPAFHVDQVQVRLICCYQTPATQWLENDQIDRTRLGRHNDGLSDSESGLLLPGTQINQMNAYDIALMKGEAWPGNQGRGLVHRSPTLCDGDGRLLFKIDAR